MNGDGRPDLVIEGYSSLFVLVNSSTQATNFDIGMASGASNSATISAGQAASFSLAVTPTGSFSGTVNLNCAITPAVTPAPVCTVPSSVNVSAGTAAAVTVKVSTTAAGTAGSISSADLPPGTARFASMTILLGSRLSLVGHRRQIPALAFPMIAVAFVAMTACGGGGGSGGGSSPGTPAGIYTATVTATSGSFSHSTALTVIVQ